MISEVISGVKVMKPADKFIMVYMSIKYMKLYVMEKL